MAWTFDGDRPIYLQIVDRLELRIVSGEYRPGERLPAVREFASEAAVNPNTMQRALYELEASGLVVTHRNVGRSVTDDESVIAAARDAMAAKLCAAYIERMAALGYDVERSRDNLDKYIKENVK